MEVWTNVWDDSMLNNLVLKNELFSICFSKYIYFPEYFYSSFSKYSFMSYSILLEILQKVRFLKDVHVRLPVCMLFHNLTLPPFLSFCDLSS